MAAGTIEGRAIRERFRPGRYHGVGVTEVAGCEFLLGAGSALPAPYWAYEAQGISRRAAKASTSFRNLVSVFPLLAIFAYGRDR